MYVYSYSVNTRRPRGTKQSAVQITPAAMTPWGRGGPPWAGAGHSCLSAGPTGDPAQLSGADLPAALMLALRRFGPSWIRFLRAHLTDDRLSPERLQLLGALAQAGEPLIMREITTLLGTTPRAVTALVDGLEGDGLVTRGPHPTDRRAVLVQLAAPGRELLREAGEGFAAAARLFDVLDSEDQRALLRMLGRLTDHLTAVHHGAGPG